MTIDLMKLAKQVSEVHEDVECSFGTIRVYHVPDMTILGETLDRPRPEMPTVGMKIPGGRTQRRPIKESDSEWGDWVSELNSYENDLFQYRTAVKTVYAMRDIDWSKVDINKPPPGFATAFYNGDWPDNEYLQKKFWIDCTVLSKTSDSDLILNAMSKMNGMNEPTDEGVEEVKKNSE